MFSITIKNILWLVLIDFLGITVIVQAACTKYNTNIKINKICSVNVHIHYWQPYLLVLYGSLLLLAGGCGGCGLVQLKESFWFVRLAAVGRDWGAATTWGQHDGSSCDWAAQAASCWHSVVDCGNLVCCCCNAYLRCYVCWLSVYPVCIVIRP